MPGQKRGSNRKIRNTPSALSVHDGEKCKKFGIRYQNKANTRSLGGCGCGRSFDPFGKLPSTALRVYDKAGRLPSTKAQGLRQDK